MIDTQNHAFNVLQTIAQTLRLLATESIKKKVNSSHYLCNKVLVSLIYKGQYSDTH